MKSGLWEVTKGAVGVASNDGVDGIEGDGKGVKETAGIRSIEGDGNVKKQQRDCWHLLRSIYIYHTSLYIYSLPHHS